MALHGASDSLKEVFPINMGEEAAFERIFRLYHAPLCYYCEQLTGVDEACEDIVSQLFLRLWQKNISFDSPEHAKAYLYRSARNACLNYMRNGDRGVQYEPLALAEDMESSEHYLNTLIQTEIWAELYRAIEGLPSQCAKVVTMSFIDGKTNQEIADELALSIQTVKNTKGRALHLLKDKLPDSLLAILIAFYFGN